MHHALTSRKEKSESQEKAFAEKFQRRFADMAKREHEDHLKHFQVFDFYQPHTCEWDVNNSLLLVTYIAQTGWRNTSRYG